MNYHQLLELQFLEKAREIIASHISNDHFDVSIMAQKMGMSRSTLNRKMRSHTGMSTGDYIREIRLTKAMELLKGSHISITEIAFECGFKSLTYFDTCFKKHFGYSPREIRMNGSERDNQLHNFPVPVTSFIGREKELKTIRDLISNTQILSLIGPGGCGKTRLACEAVKNPGLEFKDGIWFVDLAPVESADRAVSEIMKCLTISEAPNTALLETLVANLNQMNAMIVLDNCEQLNEDFSVVVEKMGSSSPSLKILVTSREIMNIDEGTNFRVPSLNLPESLQVKSVEESKNSEAIRLFEDRARLSDHRFRLSDTNIRYVASICKMLDGLPLALELVANSIRYMDPDKILERFSDRFSVLESHDPDTIDRHRTIHAAIDWSYKLLTGDEKSLFIKLSVFPGSFDLEASEKICRDTFITKAAVVDLLSNLVDHSLVYTIRELNEPLRYRLLETIRQYGTTLIDTDKEVLLKRGHLDYFTEIAEQAFTNRHSEQSKWIRILNLEYDNIIAALNWSKNHDRPGYEKLAGLIAWFLNRSGKAHQAQAILVEIIENSTAKNETEARVLDGYSWALSGDFNQYDLITRYLKQAASIWHRLGNTNEEAIALSEIAIAISTVGDNKEGLVYARKALDLANIENNPGILLFSLTPLAQILVNMKKCEEAKKVIQQFLDHGEQLDNLYAKFGAHHNFGDCAAIEGNFRLAEKEYGEGLRFTVQYNDLPNLCTELTGIAIAAAGMGRTRRALKLIGASNRIAKKAGSMPREKLPMEFWQELIREHIQGAREKAGDELTRKYEAEGAAMELEEAVAYALDFERD